MPIAAMPAPSPNSFGIWSTMMTSPMPALKPISTGSEMKLARKPSRSTEASASRRPTSSVRVARAGTITAMLPSGDTSASAAPVRMAMVVVVLTLRTWDEPSTA
jgi:hypothetical protein